jgi:hypothetical protein
MLELHESVKGRSNHWFLNRWSQEVEARWVGGGALGRRVSGHGSKTFSVVPLQRYSSNERNSFSLLAKGDRFYTFCSYS